MASTVQLESIDSYLASPNPTTISNPNFKSNGILQFNIVRKFQQIEAESESKIIRSKEFTTLRFLEIPLQSLKSPQSQQLYRLISESIPKFRINPNLCKEYLIPRIFNQTVNNAANYGGCIKGFHRMVFDIEILTVRVSDEENEEEVPICSVCLDEISNAKTFYCRCSHEFHYRCLGMWLKTKNSCPICRDLVIPELLQLYLEAYDDMLPILWRPKRLVFKLNGKNRKILEY